MDRQWYNEVSGLSVEEQFNRLYQRKILLRSENKSLWMRGNQLNNTTTLRDRLPEILEELEIKSFLDVGCGDFLWLSTLDWSNIDYHGIDIVQDLIDRNTRRYPDFKFTKMDIIREIPPKVDMVFMRSVLIHTNFPNIFKIFYNTKKSKSKYLMASTCRRKKNYESVCLMLKHQNLMRSPFNLPKPMILIKEVERNESDNYMGVWKINEL